MIKKKEKKQVSYMQDSERILVILSAAFQYSLSFSFFFCPKKKKVTKDSHDSNKIR